MTEPDQHENCGPTSSHFNERGEAHMVDVSVKGITARTATASAMIWMSREAADVVRSGTAKKGNVLGIAQIAAISATKWTPTLIPLCHSIPVEGVEVVFEWRAEASTHESGSTGTDVGSKDAQTLNSARVPLCCRVTVRTSGKTGVEMEALTGASIGALTVYDMLKSIDREMVIGTVHLEAKQGGKSGNFSPSQVTSNQPNSVNR